MQSGAETEDKLKKYLELLIKWQSKINLVSPSTLATAWERHFLDSLQLSSHISPQAKTLFDIGSGAGFPGLVLAMAHPQLNVYLIESDQKKCSFLKTVSRETATPVTIINDRIEQWQTQNRDLVPDMVSARALASLGALFSLVRPWAVANPDLRLIFPKGQNAAEEIKEAQSGWHFEVTEYPSETEPQARILVIQGLESRA